MARREIYLSTDVEADGPIPGPHSMLSFASAAYTDDKQLIATWTANLELLPGASGHPDTMAWWGSQPVAWASCRHEPRAPEVVMPEYVAWIDALPGRPVFVSYPAGFDFMFVQWYLHRFVGRSPYAHAALDVKTLAMAVLGTRFHETAKRVFPRRWFDALPHTHVALDDAIEQGALFCNILADLRGRQPSG